jgi:hypothetical protein
VGGDDQGAAVPETDLSDELPELFGQGPPVVAVDPGTLFPATLWGNLPSVRIPNLAGAAV